MANNGKHPYKIAPALSDLPHFSLGDLVELQGELKDLSEREAAKLRKSMHEKGIFIPWFIWPAPDGNNYILDGHQRKRVLVADKQGALSVPCVIVEADNLQDAKERLLVISSQYGRITQEGLDTFAFDLDDDWLADTVHFDALSFGFEDNEPEPAGNADAKPQTDRAAELRDKWQTERGQLWAIGDHRLLCGDCTVRADVERVMGGECAEMVWTDPPYGVAVGDKNKFLNSIARSNRIEENLENDTLDEPGLTAMLCAAFDNALMHCLAGGAWYVAAPAGPLHTIFGQALKDRGVWRQTIQWVKNNATFAPLGVDYRWRAEPIFYGWKPGAAHRFYGGRQQDTVWEIDRPMVSPEHPTMKPVELVQRAVANSSQGKEIIYDPFAGSGTTLVACQNLSRRGRAIEISPAYTAVILERMATAFPHLDIRLIE